METLMYTTYMQNSIKKKEKEDNCILSKIIYSNENMKNEYHAIY